MYALIILFSIFVFGTGDKPSIVLNTSDAVVWLPKQEITGEVHGLDVKKVMVHHNQNSFSTHVGNNGKFNFTLVLTEIENKIWIEIPRKRAIRSDTITYTLGYRPIPIIEPYATIKNGEIVLHAKTLENPNNLILKYQWTSDSLNPATGQILNDTDSLATLQVPDLIGTYRFNLLVVAQKDSISLQTDIKRSKEGIHCFKIDKDYPPWMSDAIIYQITPYSFVKDGTFNDITKKLKEIKDLGINTIMLQPIYETFNGYQGYDITNFMRSNPKFGTEKELHSLITKAKELEIRILFDVVLNHSSIEHPYAKDIIKKGRNSHYYDFYQHDINDGKAYSSFYNKDEHGFVTYFWKDLVNLNYDNEEVQRWMLEVCKYWIREFDIDGYRFDAIWGVNARYPNFAKRLRTELKSIKPDILLLAEDKGSLPEVYTLGFDAAYDWTPNTDWVSQWAWEYDYDESKSKTIFNHPKVKKRGPLLRNALFHNGGNSYRKLHYLENNDLPRFIAGHGWERTKMAAELLFSLPGIPMLYNGQEIGFEKHPYAAKEIFDRNRSIRALSTKNTFDYYKKLIKIHKQHAALNGNPISEISIAPEKTMVAFRRDHKDEHIIVVVNLDSIGDTAVIDLPNSITEGIYKNGVTLIDLLSNDIFYMLKGTNPVEIPMNGYSTRWLLLSKKED